VQALSECSFHWAGDGYEEALPVVTLWGRRWTRPELLARVGRLEQVAGIRLVEGGDGAERGGPGTCVSAACSPGYQRLTGPGGDFEEECCEHDMRAGPVDPAGNLDLLSAQLRTPEEVSDGQR
jgi:hypothetical protein